MKHVAVVVEGQTEQRFIEEILGPRLAVRQVYLRAIITKTSRTSRGGGGWRGYADLLETLLRQPQWDVVTTLLDWFRAPTGMPVSAEPGRDAAESADLAQHAIGAAVAGADERLRPYLMVHEFETLVIAAGAHMEAVFGHAGYARDMRSWVAAAQGNAERINGGSDTAPSKRLEYLITDYVKTSSGLEILHSVDLEAVFPSVPRFHAWVQHLAA